jgi:hypothetical protein
MLTAASGRGGAAAGAAGFSAAVTRFSNPAPLFGIFGRRLGFRPVDRLLSVLAEDVWQIGSASAEPVWAIALGFSRTASDISFGVTLDAWRYSDSARSRR